MSTFPLTKKFQPSNPQPPNTVKENELIKRLKSVIVLFSRMDEKRYPGDYILAHNWREAVRAIHDAISALQTPAAVPAEQEAVNDMTARESFFVHHIQRLIDGYRESAKARHNINCGHDTWMNDTADELEVILSEAPSPPPVEELREKLFHELMPLTQYSPDQSRLYTERILKLLATPAVSNADDGAVDYEKVGESIARNAALLRLFKNEYRNSGDRHSDALFVREYVQVLEARCTQINRPQATDDADRRRLDWFLGTQGAVSQLKFYWDKVEPGVKTEDPKIKGRQAIDAAMEAAK